MDIQSRKLDLIERLMYIKEPKILERFENTLIQIEMDEAAEKSIQAIGKGEVTSYEKFKDEAKKWIESRKSTK